MSDVLTGPVLAAAALVCVAGVAKLHAPAGAVRAMIVIFGRRARAWHVRALAAVEIALGVAVMVAPAPAPEAVLAGLYGMFAGAGAVLRRRGAGCGCFGGGGSRTVGVRSGGLGAGGLGAGGLGAGGLGAGEAPVSVAQVLLSWALALVCAAGVTWPPHRLGWALARPVLALGIAGCLYAVVLAYTQLPLAWGAWRAR